MAKEKKCDCERGAPAWVVTYGDMMSLLLTFFVLLLSFSTLEETKKFDEAIMSIQGAFGILPKELTVTQVNPMPVRMKPPSKEVEDAARRMQRELQVMGKTEAVHVEFDKTGGLKIKLPSELLFGVGQARLDPSAYPVLETISGLLADLPEAFFEVRGHTDATPVSGTAEFEDNFDLSYARAKEVMAFLQRSSDVSVEHFRITGAGPSEPVAPNVTPEGRRLNRRVEVHVRGFMTDQQVDELQQRVQQLTKRL